MAIPPGPAGAAAASAAGARWQISAAVPVALPASRSFAASDSALRQVNLQPSVLGPGEFGAFAGREGTHDGRPGYAGPWTAPYAAAVFQRRGLADPAAECTSDEVEPAAPRLPPPSPPVGSHTLGLRVASRRSNFSAGSTLRGRLRGGLRRDGGQPGPVRPDQAGGRGRPAAHGRHRGARRSRAVRGVGAGRLRAGVCPHGRALHLRPTPVLAVRWCPLGCAAPSCR